MAPVLPFILGAAEIAGPIISAVASESAQSKALDKMYPGKTQEQKDLISKLTQHSSNAKSASPFTDETGQFGMLGPKSLDRLENLRQRVAGLQNNAIQRGQSINQRAQTQNPFAGV